MPNDDELHIWCLPLTLDEDQTKVALTRLNSRQLDRYARRATAALQEPYLAGRYYLSELLSAYTGEQAAALKLSYTRLNKPYLASNSYELNFNFTDSRSHAGDIGIFVFARNRNLGVDIEALSRRSDFLPIAKRKFSQREQDWVTTQDGSLHPERFLSLWTRKEAYGKAIGKGVNFKMNALELATPHQHQLSFLGQEKPDQYFQLQQFLVASSHVACVVHEGDEALRLHAFTRD